MAYKFYYNDYEFIITHTGNDTGTYNSWLQGGDDHVKEKLKSRIKGLQYRLWATHTTNKEPTVNCLNLGLKETVWSTASLLSPKDTVIKWTQKFWKEDTLLAQLGVTQKPRLTTEKKQASPPAMLWLFEETCINSFLHESIIPAHFPTT